MQSKLHTTRARFTAQVPEADELLERIARPVLAEMAVWPNGAASNDPHRHSDARESGWTPVAWLTLVDTVRMDAANAEDPLDPWPSSDGLMRAARRHRGETIGRLLGQAAQWLRDVVAKTSLKYRRRRHARAIYGALSGLDDRTLRDLGFHRSEIWSVAAEATGEAERTRTITRAPA